MFLFIDLDHTIIDGHTNNIIYNAIEKDPSLENDKEKQWELVKGLSLIGTKEEWQKEISRLVNEGNFCCLVSFSAYPHIGKRILEEKIELEPAVLEQIPIVSYCPNDPNKENKNKHIDQGLEALAEQFLLRMEKSHETTEKEKNISKQFYILLSYSGSDIAQKFEFAKEWMTKDEKATLKKMEEGCIPPIKYLQDVILIDDTDRHTKGAKKTGYRAIPATKDGAHLKKIAALKPYCQSIEYFLEQEKGNFCNYSSFEEKHIKGLFKAIQENDENEIGKILLESIKKNYASNTDNSSDDEDCEGDYILSAKKFLERRRDRAKMSLEELPTIKEHIEKIREKVKTYSKRELEKTEEDAERSSKKAKTETSISQQNIFIENTSKQQTQAFAPQTFEIKPNQ